jgi:UDP-4-amino-4-deoxy-L-arabinose-oxoglutarate aminotransferase
MQKHKVEFFRHNISSQDIREVSKVLRSIFLTTGEWVKTFEHKFAKYLKTEYVVGVNSCTDALFLALKYYKIGIGDEVITTPMSFVATANVIEHCGARPVFVDVEKETGNIDASLVEKAITKKTKAMIVVHLYGQMCDMRALRKIANKYRLILIEDAAHCIEGKRDGVRVGELGDMACFSFYATKTMTSGEGGAISCHSKKAHEWLLRARSHGISKSAADRYTKQYQHYDLEFLGYKMNMTNIQAALLVHQMDKLEPLWKKREGIAKVYRKSLSAVKGLGLMNDLPKVKHARYILPLLVPASRRNSMMHGLQKAGIGVAVNFRPIHLMSFYKKKYGYRAGMFPNAEEIGKRTITIPLYPKLQATEVQQVIQAIKKLV